MPATNQLAKLADLADRVAVLGSKQSGMPIEAADWNSIVAVLQGLIEVERAQEDAANTVLDQRYALKDHDHLGQVTTAWLDPSLQGFIGGTGTIAGQTLVATMQQKVDSLGSEVARLASLTSDQQRLVDNFTVNDTDRATAIKGLGDRFAAVDALSTQVTTLTGSVGTLNTNVNTVLDLRKSLSDATGAPINVAQLGQQVASLTALTQNLNGVDGKPLRLRDIELQVRDLSDAVGVGANSASLDGRITTASADLQAKLGQQLDDRTKALQDAMVSAQSQATDQIKASVQSSLTDALAKNQAAIDDQFRASEARLNSTLNAGLEATGKQLSESLTASTGAAIDQRLASLPAQIDTAVKTSQAASSEQLRTDLTAVMGTSMQTAVSESETRLNASLSSSLAKQNADISASQAALQDSLTSQIAATRADLDGKQSAATAALQTVIASQVSTSVSDAVTNATASIPAQITSAVQQGTADLDSRISNALTSSLGTLPAQVQSEVQSEIAALAIPGQIDAAKSAAIAQFHSEFTPALADLQTRTTATVNALTTQLRGEIVAATKAASDATFQRASDLVTSLRTDVTSLSTRVTTEVSRLDKSIATTSVAPITSVRPVVVGGQG